MTPNSRISSALLPSLVRELPSGLTSRKKWFSAEMDLQVGEAVFVLSPDTSTGNWPLGRVSKMNPIQDNTGRASACGKTPRSDGQPL